MASHAHSTNNQHLRDTAEVRDFIDFCSDFELGVILKHVIREVGNRDLHIDLASTGVRRGDAAQGLRRLVPVMAMELSKVALQ